LSERFFGEIICTFFNGFEISIKFFVFLVPRNSKNMTLMPFYKDLAPKMPQNKKDE
jgi:hypothetical protein